MTLLHARTAYCDARGCESRQVLASLESPVEHARILRAMGWWVADKPDPGDHEPRTICPDHYVIGGGQVVTVGLCLSDPGAVVPRDHETGPERDETEPLHVWQERALRTAGLIREGA